MVVVGVEVEVVVGVVVEVEVEVVVVVVVVVGVVVVVVVVVGVEVGVVVVVVVVVEVEVEVEVEVGVEVGVGVKTEEEPMTEQEFPLKIDIAAYKSWQIQGGYSYFFEKGKRYCAQASDTAGRIFEVVELDPFGVVVKTEHHERTLWGWRSMENFFYFEVDKECELGFVDCRHGLTKDGKRTPSDLKPGEMRA